MSLFYNRDNNISGVALLTGLTFSPDYGSSVQFEAKNNYLSASDKTPSIAPLGINSVVANFDLKFSLRKNDAQQLIKFYENQSGTGIFGFSDGSNIYKLLSGTIDSLGGLDSANNGKYNVSLRFGVERNAPSLSWSGGSFVNHQFQKWETGQSYSKYDVVYFEHDMEEPVNNWFYATQNHTSSISNNPLSTGEKWTTNLFEDSNEGFTISQTPTVKKTEFKNSFIQRVNDQKNIHSFDSIEISYKDISDKKTKALLHFAESKLGYKRFKHQFPEIYNRPKLFVCPSWNHQWNSKESNNLSLSLMEDPLGIEEKGCPSITITQQSGRSSLNLNVTGLDYCFYQTGDSKQTIQSQNLSISWPNTGQSNTLKLFGPIAGLTGTGQGIIKARYDVAKNLSHLNLSGNNISVTNLYFAPNLVDFNYANNSVGGFDLRDKPLLKTVKIQNNNATYFNISNSSGVTGIFATGNRISGLYVKETFGGLYSGNLRSGYANFSGNGEISNQEIPFITGLTGRSWTVGYEYNPYFEETTTPEPEDNPTFYEIVALAGADAYSACNSMVNITGYGDSAFLEDCLKMNYRNTPYYDGNIYLSDGSGYFAFQKVCCGKGIFLESGLCSVATSTTEEPTTTTTTEEPSTTTEEPTTAPPSYCADPAAMNYLEIGPCMYP